MKLVVLLSILLVSFSVNALTKSTRSDIRVSIEDTTDLDAVDYDANDIVFCSNWQYESVTDNNSIHRVTLSITPIAAGANYSNSVYIRNPCSGSAEIELKRPEDSCGADSIIETVDQGGMLLWTSSFTDNAFSSECSRDIMINIGGNEVCAPNKSWVVIECQDGSSIDLTNEPNNEFPFAKLFHVDAKSNGTEEGKDADDVNSDTIFGGLATIIIGHCDDPVPEEKINLIDALNVRGNLNVNDCANNAETCRNAIKSILTTHRTAGWSNVANIRKRRIPTGHGISFSAKTFINDNLYTLKVGGNGRRENPIFDEDVNECSSEKNQDSYVEVPALVSRTVNSIPSVDGWNGAPASFADLYHNDSDLDGSAVIGVGEYGTRFVNIIVTFPKWNKASFYSPSRSSSNFYGYCVYNGATCPSGTITHSSGGLTFSTDYVPIPGDTAIGTSAFCVGQYRVLSSNSMTGIAHGNLIYNVCDTPTSAGLSDVEKAKFKMMTFEQYNALYREWEKTDANWSSGTSGVGYAYAERAFENWRITSTNSSESCDVNEGYWALETTNGDYVRVPNAWLSTGCRSFYTTPTIFDFDGSDDSFTKFTETETRQCARSQQINRVHRVGYDDDNSTPGRANRLYLISFDGNNNSLTQYETLADGVDAAEYLSRDTLYGGRAYLPGSTCPKIETVHTYVIY